MRKLIFILSILCSISSSAQNIDMNIRDRWQRIWVQDLYSGNLLTRYAYVYVPNGWSASNPQDYVVMGMGGDGTNGSWTDTTRDTPGHLLGNSNPNGKWNAKMVRNDGDSARFIISVIPYYGSSAQTAGSYDVYNAFSRKLVVETGLSLSTPDYRFLGMHPSGAPHRFVTSKQTTGDTANAYMQKFDRVIFMSPTNGASLYMATYYFQNGRYRVFFSKGDGNSYTQPVHAYRLRDSLARRGNNELYIDSVATGGHGSNTWDLYASTAGLNAPAGTGGDATTNIWRWLVQDYAVSNPNQIPITDAGNDITSSSTTVTLSGSANDPDGTISSYLWTKVSGTGGTITTPNAASTSVTGLSVGTYVFQLRATDNDGAFSTDQVTVTIQASNVAPTAYAGSDKNISLPVNSVALNGSLSSDPDGTISSYAWSKVSGGSATFNQPNNDVCNVINLTEGVYVFRLTVTDNSGATATDDVQVTVEAAANALPIADAGPDKAITLPTNSTTLDGTNSSDSDGTIASYSWSGPGTITNGTTASPTVSNLTAGVHAFTLTVTDNQGGVSTDSVDVIVQLPVTNDPIQFKGRKVIIVN